MNARVIEDGTGVEIHADSNYVSIQNTILSFEALAEPKYYKRGLPFIGKVKKISLIIYNFIQEL